MKMPQPIQPVTPNDVYSHWVLTDTCKFCHRYIRDEMHLYNHHRKYHLHPRYFVWDKYKSKWNETSHVRYVVARFKLHLPTAISRY